MAVDSTVIDVVETWVPGTLTAPPIGDTLPDGGTLYTPVGHNPPSSSGLTMPGFVQCGWQSSAWGVSGRGFIASNVEEAWGYGHSFTPPVEPVEPSVGSFGVGVGDYTSDVFECPYETPVGFMDSFGVSGGVSGSVSSVWDGFLVSVGGVSSGGGVVSVSGGVSLSFVEECGGVLGCVSGGGLSVVGGVGVPLWEGFVGDFSGLSVSPVGFGALPFGGGGSGGVGVGDALVGCFPLSVGVRSGISSGVSGSSGGVSLVGVPVVSGVSGFGGLSVSWGLSSASLGVLSIGGGGSGWRGVLGVSGLGAGGFVPGVVGVSGGVGVGSEVVVDGVTHRGLVFGSRLAPAGFVDLGVGFGSVFGGSPVGSGVSGLGRFGDWWLVRNWVGSVVGGVGRACWGDVVGTISAGSGIEPGLGLGFVGGSEGYGSPVGVVSGGGGSAGLFGGSAGVGEGFVGGVVDVPVGSPVVGLGVDLVDVAGVVSDLL